jgi:PAS domain S-box-containing protein
MTGNQNRNGDIGSDEKAIIETELNFHSLFTAMTEGVAIHQMIYDAGGKAVDYVIRDVNPSFEKNLGISAHKAKGAHASELYNLTPPPYIDIYEHVLKTGDPYFFTTYFEPLDRYFEISVFIPKKGWFATVFLDVTGSRHAVAELRSTGNKYRRLYESMMDGFARTDMDGKITEFNSCFQTMLGYTEEELLKLTYKDITPKQWNEYESRIIHNQVIPNGYSNVFEKEYRRKDGIVFPVEIRISLIRDEKGKPEGMWSVVREITDRKNAELEFERMIDRFNLATRSGNMGVWEWDILNDRLHWDDKMFEIYGIEREGFSANQEAWRNMLHPEDIAGNIEDVQQALRGEREYDCEYRIVLKDGSIRSVKTFGQVVRDATGTPLRMTGINFDITDQKKIQESLIISEMFNRGLVESAPVGILFLDQTGKITYENPALQQMMGLSEGSESMVVGKFFQDLPPIKKVLSNAEISRLLGGARIDAYEIHYTSLVGKELDLEVYSAPLQNKLDGIHGIVLMVVDITKPILAGKKLRESEQKYRRLYESMRDGFVRLDMQKHILDFNSFFPDMTGYSTEELSRMDSIRSLVPEKWHEKVDKIISNQILVQGYSDLFEIEYRRKDDSTFPVEIRLFLNKNQAGVEDGMWAIVRDITERKKMETELKEMNARLEQKVEQKTRELQDRVIELERFYKATIDRELRMKEMRTQIEELEKHSKKNLPA